MFHGTLKQGFTDFKWKYGYVFFSLARVVPLKATKTHSVFVVQATGTSPPTPTAAVPRIRTPKSRPELYTTSIYATVTRPESLIDSENAGEGKVTGKRDSALCYSRVINIEPWLDAVSNVNGVWSSLLFIFP